MQPSPPRLKLTLGVSAFLFHALMSTVNASAADYPAKPVRIIVPTIAGAGLDVYRDEPQVPAALLALDNVVMTPHVGSTTLEIREGRKQMVLANLHAHFAGQALPSPLT